MKSSFLRRFSPLALVLVIAAAPGCDGDSPIAPTLPEGPVVPVELYASSSSGLVVSERRIVRQQSEFDTLWTDLFADGTPVVDQPLVDFNTDIVLAVASGEQPEGCYSIEVTSASADGTDLTAIVTETGPDATCICTQALVQPVQVVQVPRADQVFFQTVTATDCPADV